MKIIRAEHLGMCFGVRDAIALAKDKASAEPVTILGELVHNETVLEELRSNGVRFEKEIGNVTTQNVLITAHGASTRKIEAVRALGHAVAEATCPLVHHAHRSLQRLVNAGYHPVVIGKRDHVEVKGMTEDYDSIDVILTAEDVVALEERPRFGVVSQTTQPIERVQYLVGLMRQIFPCSEVRFLDTVCQPTKQRQSAAIELGRQCDVVIVIGGSNSNNTKELVTSCKRFCARVHHVQTAADIEDGWFHAEDTVGITAGTSTPDLIIDAVEQRITRLNLSAATNSTPQSNYIKTHAKLA